MIAPPKELIGRIMGEKSSGLNGQFLKVASRKYWKLVRAVKGPYCELRVVLAGAMDADEPLKTQGQKLANALRDFIFDALTFCTTHDDVIPVPGPDFEQIFLRDDLTEFMTAQEGIVSEIHAAFAVATQKCLEMTARYQGVTPQSMKPEKHLLDLALFPHFCNIEEDAADLYSALMVGKSLVDDLYMRYVRLMEKSAIFLAATPDPVNELEKVVSTMREQLGECEKLFVKKTALFRELYEKLSPKEKEEFVMMMMNGQGGVEEERELSEGETEFDVF